MANTIPKLFDTIQTTYLPIYLHNPTKRFITAADEQAAINAAAIELAMDTGGIRVIDNSSLSVAGQRDYPFATQHKKIVKAEYIQHVNASNETITPLDVIDMKGQEFLANLSNPVVFDNNNLTPFLTGTPQPLPKFLQWWPEIYTFRLLDTPSVSGDTIRLYCRSLPSNLSSGVTYDGSEEDLVIIAKKAAGILRIGKTRDTQEGQMLLDGAEKMTQSKRGFENRKRRPRQLEDGRFEVTRLRSINGSR